MPLASQVAAAATLISTASRLLSSLSNVTRSPNACEYQDTQVIVIQLHFQSALNAGSNCTDAFSHKTILPVIVPQASESFESHIALVAFALGIVSSFADTDDRSLSMAIAVIFHQVALPTTVCSHTVSATGVSSVVA
jgi:hypothetical protein